MWHICRYVAMPGEGTNVHTFVIDLDERRTQIFHELKARELSVKLFVRLASPLSLFSVEEPKWTMEEELSNHPANLRNLITDPLDISDWVRYGRDPLRCCSTCTPAESSFWTSHASSSVN